MTYRGWAIYQPLTLEKRPMRRSQRTWIDEVLEKLFVFALIAAAIYFLNIFFPAIGIMPYFSFFPGVSLMPYKAQQGHNGVMTAGVPSKGIKEHACHRVPIVVSCKLLIPPHNNIIIFWRFA